MLSQFIVRAQPMPHLAYVYPAGGRVGTSFQIVVGGQFLQTISNAVFTGGGIRAEFVECTRPMNNKEFTEKRDRLKELEEKLRASRKTNPGTNVWTSTDTREMENLRDAIIKNPPNRTANPAMIDTAVINVSINTNAGVGEYELRLLSRNALSNPLKFRVGSLAEVSKPPSKPANPELDRFLERLGRKTTPTGTPKYEARVSLPVTLNGQIMPGGVDRYRFFASRGQQLVLTVSARSLIPYIADAVPGWFEATLTLYDPKGKEQASGERFRFHPDPFVHFEVPRDGEYTVEIHDSIYRGREDFVYRLSIGEMPFVNGIFPLGGRIGGKTTVTLAGWNLQNKTLICDNANSPLGVRLLNGDFLNEVPFAVDDLPESDCSGSNHSIQTAQPIELPITINGLVSKPGENEVFGFQGHAGQHVVAEVFARRLDSPLDSLLRLTDAKGTQIAFNDDWEDKSSGLETHHADSYLTATLPEAGWYFIHLSDSQGHCGPDYAYRLRVSEPRPDFALRVVPSSISVRAGMSAPVTVYALRKDGFTNAIDLKLKGAPAGFSLSGGKLPENQDKIQLTLKAPPQSAGETMVLSMEGDALIRGNRIVRRATPAEDMMQAFFYRHLVSSHELEVVVAPNPRPFAMESIKVIGITPVRIPSGQSVHVRISTPSQAFSGRFQMELQGAPDGISLQSSSPAENGIDLVIAADREKLKPGAQGNLVFDILPKHADSLPNAKKAGLQQRQIVVGTIPAIPFTVVAD